MISYSSVGEQINKSQLICDVLYSQKNNSNRFMATVQVNHVSQHFQIRNWSVLSLLMANNTFGLGRRG